ncbi:hypothetical protein AAG906_019084 [Vitis piasezkii]
MQMVVAHCGRCAERVVFGDEITDGGRDDLEKITKPKNSRLGLTALTKRVGLMDRLDSPDGELIKYSIIFSIYLCCIISSIHIWVCSI